MPKPSVIVLVLALIWCAMVAIAWWPGGTGLPWWTEANGVEALQGFALCQVSVFAAAILTLVYTLDRRHRMGRALRRIGYAPAVFSGLMLVGMGAFMVYKVSTAI